MLFEAVRSKRRRAILAPFEKQSVVDFDVYLNKIIEVFADKSVIRVELSLLISEIKRKIFIDALKKNNFVIADTARFLNIQRSTLTEMLKSHNINISDLRRQQRGNPSKSRRKDIRCRYSFMDKIKHKD